MDLLSPHPLFSESECRANARNWIDSPGELSPLSNCRTQIPTIPHNIPTYRHPDLGEPPLDVQGNLFIQPLRVFPPLCSECKVCPLVFHSVGPDHRLISQNPLNFHPMAEFWSRLMWVGAELLTYRIKAPLSIITSLNHPTFISPTGPVRCTLASLTFF